MHEDNENLAWYAIRTRFNPLSLLYRLYERLLFRRVKGIYSPSIRKEVRRADGKSLPSCHRIIPARTD
jgi:hypothetical protein